MPKFKKIIIIVLLLMFICNNSYCIDNVNTEGNNTIEANRCYNNKITDYFFSGITDGVRLSKFLLVSFFFILATSMDKTSDIFNENLNITKPGLLQKLNFPYIITLFILEPFLVALIDNIIIRPSLEDVFSAILPITLSNKKLYDSLSASTNYNIPIVNSFITNMLTDATRHSAVNPSSTSYITELLTNFTLANFTMLFFSSKENIYTGIIRAVNGIWRASIYKTGGYVNAVSHDIAVHIVLSFSATLLLIFGSSLFVDINIVSK